MYLRPAPTDTLAKFIDGLGDDEAETLVCKSEEIKVNLTDGAPTLTLGEGTQQIQIPATEAVVDTFGDYVGIPTPFSHRLIPRLQQDVLQTFLIAAATPLSVQVRNGNVLDVGNASKPTIRPKSLLERVAKVLSPEADVIFGEVSPSEVRLDVVVHDGAPSGIGGDFAVGDITRGGLRLGYNRKRNLAPWVVPYAYRLVCTNGQEAHVTHEQASNRKGVENVLDEFERAAALAFSDVEALITSYYDLREVKVDNVERTLVRVGREQKVTGRIIGRLVDEALSIDTDTPTMFDVVNHITNMANEPSVGKRDGARRILERAGGALVTEHAARCGRCLSRL